MTRFLDTEIALAIKPTPQNKCQNVDTKSRLNGRDLQYSRENIKYKSIPFTGLNMKYITISLNEEAVSQTETIGASIG